MEKAEEAALLDVAGVVAGVGGRFYISCRVGWHIGKVRTLPAVDSARLLCGTVIEISIFVLFHTQKLTAKVVPGTSRQVNGMTIAGGGGGFAERETRTAREVGWGAEPYLCFAVDCEVCRRDENEWVRKLPEMPAKVGYEGARIALGRKFGWGHPAVESLCVDGESGEGERG